MIWICNGHQIFFDIKVFFYLFPVFTLFPSENNVWNLLTRRLSSRALVLLQTHVWLVLLSCLCTLKLCQSGAALRCAVLFCAVLCCDAGSSLGAKWFLSLGKQSPSNLSPLRSIWIHFTLTRRKTSNLRPGLGQELSLQVKGLQCVSVCVHCGSDWVCVGLVHTHRYLYEQRCVCTVYMVSFSAAHTVNTAFFGTKGARLNLVASKPELTESESEVRLLSDQIRHCGNYCQFL